MPPGIPPDMAIEFMNRLKAGSTVRKLTGGGKALGPALVTFDRFKKHCELHPEWGAEAWRISKINCNLGKGYRLRKLTEMFCLKGLHRMIGANVRIDPSRGRRCCLACRNFARDNPPKMTALAIANVRKALQAGATTSQICNGHPAGGGRINRSLILTTGHKFYQQRRLDPEFNRFVLDAIEKRIGASNPVLAVAAGTYKYQWDPGDPELIRSMLPEYFPDKDVVVNEVIVSLLEGRLDRSQIGEKLRLYIKAHYRAFPTNFAKFGNSRLVSLDEVLFEDGSTTRGDTVWRGLWD
jgi:hypothetical protein